MRQIRHIIALLLLITTYSAGAQAQSQIESKADYEKVRASITALSKKLYGYAKKYPSYSFSAQYDETGKLIGMLVTGVTNKADAEQISSYLLQLEVLGDAVRSMNYNHLPATTGNVMSARLTESEAKQYKPEFEGDPMTSVK